MYVAEDGNNFFSSLAFFVVNLGHVRRGFSFLRGGVSLAGLPAEGRQTNKFLHDLTYPKLWGTMSNDVYSEKASKGTLDFVLQRECSRQARVLRSSLGVDFAGSFPEGATYCYGGY